MYIYFWLTFMLELSLTQGHVCSLLCYVYQPSGIDRCDSGLCLLIPMLCILLCFWIRCMLYLTEVAVSGRPLWLGVVLAHWYVVYIVMFLTRMYVLLWLSLTESAVSGGSLWLGVVPAHSSPCLGAHQRLPSLSWSCFGHIFGGKFTMNPSLQISAYISTLSIVTIWNLSIIMNF